MHYLTSPIGIDHLIQVCQATLDDQLHPKHRSAIYGRAFRNRRGDSIVPEVYVGGNEYKDVKFDDRNTIQVFFDPMGEISYDDGTATTEVGVVVTANIALLYPDRGRSATEEIIRDVIDTLEMTPCRVLRVLTGLEAYEPFDIAHAKIDMQPWYTFRVVCEMRYIYQNC
jgi:hypothetical protein